ncbi:MAG: alpha/beta fold hydrolase [Gammaproteobacteria bacterium]|nr:alpha/beta fold hydrolase [Gammaproteobacteria bacterium]NIR82196.1 alpha/beta fold hydrolase [Gammaproteobacteria bacterium]NIR90795.1 alpha/beta fold hydrolase [Gammaproteobacteria bacterium]NIU03346.1 alpha/beta fold hydrolase [Gammaproteobacteria bacterium]NIV50842.1 alpha/beta fold hydrolase [Gammaproteobacteria bacterium]
MKLYQQVHGCGPDVLLLHGWGLNSDVWSPLLSTPGGFRLRTLDLPGYGRSSESECLHTLDALSTAVAAGIPGPAVWVGWSLGGLLALHAACRWPDCAPRTCASRRPR